MEIEHPPREEIQWDWLELHQTPWGEPAFVLVGRCRTLAGSGRCSASRCPSATSPRLHTILAALGGTPRVWRTDRMAAIVIPGTDRLTVDAANLAEYYGVEVAVCPPRRAQRKGVVEKAVESAPSRRDICASLLAM